MQSLINTVRPHNDFRNHITDPENIDIVFSAPFGSGKTYFLKEFFSINKQTYNTFWISPVNYVVGKNEDIFEYIKFDILFQILNHSPIDKLSKVKFSELEYIQNYIHNNPNDLVNVLLSVITDYGDLADPSGTASSTAKIGKTTLEVIEKYKKFKSSIKTQLANREDIISDYLQKSTHLKGSIYEDDIISQILRDCLQIIHNEKRSVLIIDDLDRLDPEHIFRILNILSVHQKNIPFHFRENEPDTNKFGFDKIILVCDIDNIKNIYQYKYGENVDFEGYIGKYYSKDIFRFNNSLGVKEFLANNLVITGLGKDYDIILAFMVEYFLEQRKITTRNLIKFTHSYYPETFEIIDEEFSFPDMVDFQLGIDPRIKIYKSKKLKVLSSDFPIIKIIKILTVIFGDFNSLYSAISNAKPSKSNGNIEIRQSCIRGLVPIIYLFSNFEKKSEITFPVTISNNPATGQELVLHKPLANLFGEGYLFDLGWSEECPYLEGESFFKNTVNLKNFTLRPTTNNGFGKNASEYINHADLASTIKNIIDSLNKYLLLQRSGIMS